MGTPSSKGKRLRGRPLQRARQQMFKTNPLCARCLKVGRYRLGKIRDHIVPLYKGGREHPSNTQLLCEECNEEKTREDMNRVVHGTALDGAPMDPEHHWNLEEEKISRGGSQTPGNDHH